MLTNDITAYRQAESCSGDMFLRCKRILEDLGVKFTWNPCPVVSDAYSHVVFFDICVNEDSAVSLSCLCRVEQQIDKNMLYLILVA